MKWPNFRLIVVICPWWYDGDTEITEETVEDTGGTIGIQWAMCLGRFEDASTHVPW